METTRPEEAAMTITALTIPMPPVPDGENWAEVATAAWIAEHGGVDVTEGTGTEDCTTWAGDVALDGVVYRLTVADDGRDEITATPIGSA
jgi:hypothetical protein